MDTNYEHHYHTLLISLNIFSENLTNVGDTTDLNNIEIDSLEDDSNKHHTSDINLGGDTDESGHTEDDIYAHINAATINEDTVIITVFIERTTEGIKFAKQIDTKANIENIANTIDRFITNVQKTQIQKTLQTTQTTQIL